MDAGIGVDQDALGAVWEHCVAVIQIKYPLQLCNCFSPSISSRRR